MLNRIAVIGGGAAGASAAARAKKLNPAADVVLIEASSIITHAPCAIPYAIAGIVKRDMFLYTPEEFERERGIKVLVNSVVTDIDIDKRVLHVRRDRGYDRLEWSKLVIATGAIPSTPSIPGIDLKGVATLRHPAYVDEIRGVLAGANTVAVVGGSYLGVEMAEALLSIGKKALVIEKENRLMPTALDEDMSEILVKELTSKGVELHLNEQVVELTGKDRVERVVTNRNSYTIDAVILATGAKPNVELAQKAGIKLGSTGAIYVNEYMETSIEGVYAAGDVAEKYHRILKKSVWLPLATTANKEGQVAGANSVLGRAIKFPGVVGAIVTRFFDVYVAKTGLTTREAIENGIKVESKTIKSKTKAAYFPGSADVYVKLIVESSTERILGAQAIGWDHSIASYIDVISAAITSGMTIEDLFFLDIGYTPSTSPVWHPLITAARVFSKGRF